MTTSTKICITELQLWKRFLHTLAVVAAVVVVVAVAVAVASSKKTVASSKC